MSKKDNSYDYQLDLTPFISLLSVCICFLLVTVAWYQVGSLSMKQVLGGDTSEVSEDNKPSLWIHLQSRDNILVKIKKGKRKLSQKIIPPLDTQTEEENKKTLNYPELKKYVATMKKQIPNLEQAFILPKKNTVYEDLIKVMDHVRQSGVFNLGVSPI